MIVYNGLDHGLSHPGWSNGIVDSPEQARIRVREHKQRGADVIKLMPSGGVASTGDDPRQQLMTNDEMRVAVETAHSLGNEGSSPHLPRPGNRERRARRGRLGRAWIVCNRRDVRADEGARNLSGSDTDCLRRVLHSRARPSRAVDAGHGSEGARQRPAAQEKPAAGRQSQA